MPVVADAAHVADNVPTNTNAPTNTNEEGEDLLAIELHMQRNRAERRQIQQRLDELDRSDRDLDTRYTAAISTNQFVAYITATNSETGTDRYLEDVIRYRRGQRMYRTYRDHGPNTRYLD